MSFKKTVLFLLLISASFILEARHIVGGDIEVRASNLDGDNMVTYDVTLNVYRDCFQGGIAMITGFGDDATTQRATIGIFRRVNGSWQFFRSLSVERQFTNGERILPENTSCIEIPPSLCVDRNEYNFTIDLPIHDDSYLISYQRCCRNETITNIVEPGDQGIAYTYEITAASQQIVNSSPSFNNFPPILICVNRPFFFDHSASDDNILDPEGGAASGNQLVYEFCNPLTAGGPDIFNSTACDGTTPSPENCLPPFERVVFRRPNFSADNPLPGTVDFTIDPETGLITGTPSEVGQYVLGVCVKEFRDGVLISTLQRDIQFNVTNCNFAQAEIQSDSIAGPDQYVRVSCGETTVDFINLSNAEFVTDGYLWEFDINGEIRTFTDRDVSVTFPDIGTYNGTLTVNPNTDCAAVAEIFTNIRPEINADFGFLFDTCIAGPVDFDASMSTTGADFFESYEWDFGDSNTGRGESTVHQYQEPGMKNVTLSVRDNNQCTDNISKVINWTPIPQLIVVEPSTFRGCLPANVAFNNLTTPINEDYDIRWDFGDGNTSDEISPTHVYEEEGVYSVSVSIVSPLNCSIERTFNSWIRVEEKPTADFTFSPPFPNAFNRTVQFTDQSIDAISWQWNFSDEGSAFEPNPNYTFPDTGFQTIDLVVRHVSGCTDTATVIIDIRPESTFFMPNAFTPNTDANNDVFKGIGFTEGISDFSMTIWSRWGEQVFSTDDPIEGWNGRKDNTGRELPNGVYVYLVTYNDPRNRAQQLKGFATLIR